MLCSNCKGSGWVKNLSTHLMEMCPFCKGKGTV